MMKTDLARAERELKFVEGELAKLGVFDEVGMDVPAAGVPAVVVQPGRQLRSTPSTSSLYGVAGSSAGVAVEELGGSAASSSAGGGGRDDRSSRSRLSLRSLLSERHHHRRSKSALPGALPGSGAGADAVRPLAAVLEAEQATVPRVVRECCDFLRAGDGARLDVEGLFRISPNQEALRFVLGASVESGAPCALADCDLCRDDPHLVAAVLKRYLAEHVADALLSDEAFQCLAALARRDGGLDGNLAKVRHVVERVVPPAHRTVLHYLVLFFRDVAAHAAHNKMDAANIGVVFGPALFHLHAAASAYDSVAQSAVASNAIRVLIEHYPAVFPPAHRGHGHGHSKGSHALSSSGRRSKRRRSSAAGAAGAPAADTPAASAAAAAGSAAPESPCAKTSLSRSARRSGRRTGGGGNGAAAPAAVPSGAVPAPAETGDAPGAGLMRSVRRGTGTDLSGSQRRALSIVRRDGSSPSKSLESSLRSCGRTGAADADAAGVQRSGRASSRRPSVGSDVTSLSARLSQCTLDD